MPRITVWAIRLALLQFVIATSLGAAALLHRAFPGALNPSVQPGAHAEVALMGFMLPFAFGVATWILPRRGPLPELALVAAFLFLHVGVVLVVSGALVPQGGLLGRLAQGAGLAIMLVHILPRVRAAAGIHWAASTKRAVAP